MVKYILDSRFWCVEEEDNYFKADLGHSNEALSQTWKGQVKTRHSSRASPRTRMWMASEHAQQCSRASLSHQRHVNQWMPRYTYPSGFICLFSKWRLLTFSWYKYRMIQLNAVGQLLRKLHEWIQHRLQPGHSYLRIEEWEIYTQKIDAWM